MIGAFRIEAYVIVSADGMIADATGIQPAVAAFRSRPAAVSGRPRSGRRGGERAQFGGSAGGVRRAGDASSSPGRSRGSRPDPDNPEARLWNPAGASLEAACAAFGLASGAVAVIGGPQAFTLFLKLGYDCFHLSRAVKVRLPGGLPLFGGDPDATLAAAGLEARPPVRLEDGLILTDWERAR